MLRLAFNSFVVVLFAAPTIFAQNDIDAFTFPSLETSEAGPTARSITPTAPIVLPEVAEETGVPSVAPPAPVSPAPPTGKLTNAIVDAHNAASQLYPHTAGSALFLSSGPSRPSPLLSYMQCAPNSCPDVWAGFASQHAADQAAYCNLHCSHGCSCGGHCGGALYDTAHGAHSRGNRLHHNRYTNQCDSNACAECADSCDSAN